jgi:hypothetical protein
VVVLCGGDKASQPRDIARAQAYWREYRQHANLPDDPGSGGRVPPHAP